MDFYIPDTMIIAAFGAYFAFFRDYDYFGTAILTRNYGQYILNLSETCWLRNVAIRFLFFPIRNSLLMAYYLQLAIHYFISFFASKIFFSLFCRLFFAIFLLWIFYT